MTNNFNEALAIVEELITQQKDNGGFTSHEEEVLKEFLASVKK